jgi:hypothetical protein
MVTPSSCSPRLYVARSAIVAVQAAAGLAAEEPGVHHPARTGIVDPRCKHHVRYARRPDST